MILDTTGSGPLGLAIRQAIRAKGEEVREAAVGEPSDLFMAALDCRAIVCTAAPTFPSSLVVPITSSAVVFGPYPVWRAACLVVMAGFLYFCFGADESPRVAAASVGTTVS